MIFTKEELQTEALRFLKKDEEPLHPQDVTPVEELTEAWVDLQRKVGSELLVRVGISCFVLAVANLVEYMDFDPEETSVEREIALVIMAAAYRAKEYAATVANLDEKKLNEYMGM